MVTASKDAAVNLIKERSYCSVLQMKSFGISQLHIRVNSGDFYQFQWHAFTVMYSD